jgi:hypothetical protein
MNESCELEPDDDSDALKQELLKGLDSPAREMTKEDWETLRQRVWERHKAKKAVE